MRAFPAPRLSPGPRQIPPEAGPESEIQGFDTGRSKELAQRGWMGGHQRRRDRGQGGEELELRLFVRSEDKDSVTAGQFIEDWFKEAGSAWRPRPSATRPSPTPSTRQTTTCSSGAGARTRIPTSSSRCSPATRSWAGRIRSGATRTTPGCTRSRRSSSTSTSGPPPSRRCSGSPTRIIRT